MRLSETRYVALRLQRVRDKLTVAITGLLLTFALTPAAQQTPDLSGTWTLDAARSGPTREVWGQQRPRRLAIAQSSSELVIDTGDGSIVGVSDPLVFKLDHTPTTVVDRSLGDLPGFSRSIRTDAMWDGGKLVTRTTHFAERRVGASDRVEIVPGAITRILIFSLLSDGITLMVERTGLREQPPEKLHGRPYRREDDLVYNKDVAYYLK